MELLKLFHPGEKLLLALSGGADSTALLLLMLEESKSTPLQLFAAHFHHGLRGKSADDDLAFVTDLCARHRVPLTTGFGDMRSQGLTGETAAREARYSFLRETMHRLRADVIVTAHNADDQAETILMHILRGAGVSGAAGMRPRTEDIARPLLRAARSEIEAYLAACGQPFRTDETNLCADNPRNILRLEALPAIERAYPGARRALVRFGEASEVLSGHLQREAEEFLGRHLESMPFGWRLRDAPADDAVLHQALHRLLPGFCREDILRAAALCRAGGRGRLSMRGIDLEKNAGCLYGILRDRKPSDAETPFADGARLDGAGTLRALPCDAVPVFSNGPVQAVDASALDGCVLRFLRAGDRIRPLGCGEKAVSDLLTDRKVPRPLRAWLPVLARGRTVLWIPGVALHDDCAIRGTCRAVRVIWQPDPGAVRPECFQPGITSESWNERGITMHHDLDKILITEEQIQQRVTELGEAISRDFAGEEVVLVGILKGAVIFFADLARRIRVPVRMDFMAISSYGNATKTTGVVRILKDLDKDITGKNVIIVEDIIDSGMSLSFLKENLISRGAKQLKICVLLDKPDRRRTHVDVDYRGFVVPDEFVVGYGLDYAEHYRELPMIGVLKEEIYTNV